MIDTKFVFHLPTKVYFGENQLVNLAPELKKYGTRVLMVYGGGSIKRSGLYDKVMKQLNEAKMIVFELGGVEPNPDVTSLNDGAAICKKENVDIILAIGGGSVIDASKGIASATFYDGNAWDLCDGTARTDKFLPIIAIPTIAAAGSELDGGSVISNKALQKKQGLGNPELKPKVAFIDPTNTYGVNAFQTACGAVDIMAHIIDTAYFYVNKDLEFLEGFMESVMRMVIKFAPIAIKDPTNYEARANLMWASSLALSGLFQGGRGLDHFTASNHVWEHELSGLYDITHGLGLAITIPRWLKYCLNETTAPKYYQFGVKVFGIDPSLDIMTVANKSIEMLSDFFFKTLGLQSTFTEVGIDETNFEAMAEGSTNFYGNIPGFITLEKQDVINIFKMCL